MRALRPRQYRECWSPIDEQQGRVVLLDVREADELAISRLDQARHIPMAQLPQRIAELDPATPLVVLCRSGQRSALVVNYLQQRGFVEVYNLAGGINAWAEELDPSLPQY